MRADLSSAGGPKDARVLDGIAREIDIETGEVLFDYFHINSIDVDPDGNLLVSSCTTFTVYKIDRETGEVLWRLGGKGAPSRWVRTPEPATSTMPAASQTAP